jgi:hypothetical protein
MKKVFILIALFAITASAEAQFKFTSNSYFGIGTNTPQEKFQIGSIWTFHDGGTKFIGRNVRYNASLNPAKDVRIEKGIVSMIRMDQTGHISLEVDGGPSLRRHAG